MNRTASMRDPQTRRRIFWTAVATALLALAFYVGFILVLATDG